MQDFSPVPTYDSTPFFRVWKRNLWDACMRLSCLKTTSSMVWTRNVPLATPCRWFSLPSKGSPSYLRSVSGSLKCTRQEVIGSGFLSHREKLIDLSFFIEGVPVIVRRDTTRRARTYILNIVRTRCFGGFFLNGAPSFDPAVFS